jgi:hypothetical protein
VYGISVLRAWSESDNEKRKCGQRVKGAYAYSRNADETRDLWSSDPDAFERIDGQIEMEEPSQDEWRSLRTRASDLVFGDWGGGENFAEDGEDVGDAERFLEAARLVRTGGLWLDKIAGHVNDDGFVDAGGG